MLVITSCREARGYDNGRMIAHRRVAWGSQSTTAAQNPWRGRPTRSDSVVPQRYSLGGAATGCSISAHRKCSGTPNPSTSVSA